MTYIDPLKRMKLKEQQDAEIMAGALDELAEYYRQVSEGEQVSGLDYTDRAKVLIKDLVDDWIG